MLDCKDIRVRFGKREILHGISASFETGKIYVLLGKNGSGKTTWLRTLSGSIRKYSGRISYDGQELKKISERELAKKMSLLPQVLPQPSITVSELITFGRSPYLPAFTAALPEKDAALVRQAISDFSLEEKKDAFLFHLSGGERARAFFAMTCVKDTPCIYLDEPAAALDPQFRKQIYTYVSQMRDAGKMLILTMHDINDALNLGDEILVLDRGVLVFRGTPEDLRASHIPEDIFGLKKETAEIYR